MVTSLFVFLIKHSPNFCVAKKIHLSILLAVFNGSCAQSVPAHTRWNGAYDQNVYFTSIIETCQESNLCGKCASESIVQ